jgi:hypothetical protein
MKYKILNIEWILKGLPNYVITINSEIWQLPFQSGQNYYGYRQIKESLHQGQIKYRINNKRYTKKQLNELAISKSFKITTNILIDKPFEL